MFCQVVERVIQVNETFFGPLHDQPEQEEGDNDDVDKNEPTGNASSVYFETSNYVSRRGCEYQKGCSVMEVYHHTGYSTYRYVLGPGHLRSLDWSSALGEVWCQGEETPAPFGYCKQSAGICASALTRKIRCLFCHYSSVLF